MTEQALRAEGRKEAWAGEAVQAQGPEETAYAPRAEQKRLTSRVCLAVM